MLEVLRRKRWTFCMSTMRYHIRERVAWPGRCGAARLPFYHDAARDGHYPVGNNPNFLPITRYSIEQSDGVTSISRYLLRQTVANLGSSGQSK